MEISAKTALLVFREQMEIRTNGNLPAALSLQKTKWKTRRLRSGHFVCFLSYTTLQPHHSRFMFRCECTLCLFRSTSYWHVSLPVFSKSLGGSFRVYKCESTIAGPTYENKLATLISLEWPLWVVVLPFSGFDRNSKPAPGQTKNFVCNNATKLFTTPEAWVATVVVSGLTH